jgi:CheY-like chemotaxis protein
MATLLVIEDEEPVRANIVRVLTAAGHRVITASDGDEGIESARELRPDLVICDTLMPRVDGDGVLAALRSQPETVDMPFIFLTASADKAEFARRLDSGANDCIAKPFKPEQLLDAIRMRLK